MASFRFLTLSARITAAVVVVMTLLLTWLPWEHWVTGLLLADFDFDFDQALPALPLPDVVVVLGTSVELVDALKTVVPTPELSERVLAAMGWVAAAVGRQMLKKQLRTSEVPPVLFSGGPNYAGHISEAEAMRHLWQAVERNNEIFSEVLGGGRNPNRLILEQESVSTWTNAVRSKQLIEENLQLVLGEDVEKGNTNTTTLKRKDKPLLESGRPLRILLVTSSYHQARSRLVFQKVFRAGGETETEAEISLLNTHAALVHLAARQAAIFDGRGDEEHHSIYSLNIFESSAGSSPRAREEDERSAFVLRRAREVLQRAREREQSFWRWLQPDRESLRRKYMVAREVGALVKYWYRGYIR